MNYYKLLSILSILLITCLGGCKKYLNVSDELAGGILTVDQVFENPAYTRRWYANVMSGIPDYSSIIRANWDYGGESGILNPWTSMTDEVNSLYGDAGWILISPRNSS